LNKILARFGNLFSAAAITAGAFIFLGVLQKLLNRRSDLSGARFRHQLIMSGAIFVMLLVIILSLPIPSATKGQLITLIGLIISAAIALSSSTIMGNAMAGIMLKTVRSFRAGDFVKVGEHMGRVTERGLFHTEIQTPDRDLVTLPNMYLANSPVTVARSSGTVISATVSLGYDVSQAKIKKLLQEAAGSIGLEEPFVQVLELGDFSVTYRAACLLTETKRLLTYKSRLRSSIIDTLHDGGVEIVSPHFRNLRTFETGKNFVPVKSRRKEPEAVDSAPIEVVFDKAEVAESLSSLRKQRADLEEEIKAEKQKAKEAETDGAREGFEAHIALLEKQATRLEEAVVHAEAADDAKED
jgi:small conductance mechanosensitive channel